ncbi:Inner membrane protein YihY, formerly thought to be RNase BN [hydrothermal vent metagenome]|uniref:Inner membrane protein YihY, formerly thought to be RNase BN n=1 Tax=hydrothermal vent metagenome TaxID=652676 RepID=A0A1W1CG63_9ZZZZ
MKIFSSIPQFIKTFREGLFDDRIGYYASSMSWSTLFAIIPILVILLSVFTHLPIFDTVYQDIHNLLFTNLMPTHSAEIMKYIDEFVANSASLGMVGVVYVLIATVMFFKDYDFVVNDIFETPRRTAVEAFRAYTLLVLIVPIMLGVSFYISSKVQYYLNKSEITNSIHLYYFLPFLMIWGTFYVAYQLSAHTTISKRVAFVSSFAASLLWYLAKMGFIFYVTKNHTYTSIYGGISTLLFFFLWIYISWMIFLYGLRFCYLLDKGKKDLEDNSKELL